jgi:uncharacterized protein (TIGR03083 family)
VKEISMTEISGLELAAFYGAVRDRLCALMGGLTSEQLALSVAACPGWTVHDTFAHVIANPEDGLAGRIQGIPDDDFTAAQVARGADRSVDEMIASWNATGPQMEPVIAAVGMQIAPIVIDAHTHEQDILAAVGRKESRETPAMAWIAARLRRGFDPEIPASDFEVVRARLGRRSRAQVLAWAWESTPDLDGFFIFGPRDDDLLE